MGPSDRHGADDESYVDTAQRGSASAGDTPVDAESSAESDADLSDALEGIEARLDGPESLSEPGPDLPEAERPLDGERWLDRPVTVGPVRTTQGRALAATALPLAISLLAGALLLTGPPFWWPFGDDSATTPEPPETTLQAATPAEPDDEIDAGRTPIQIDASGGTLPSLSNPVFNAFTEVANGVGNEADFVRVRPSTGDSTDNGTDGDRNALFVNALASPCSVGDEFDVRTYVHNAADPNLNLEGEGTAVARNVEVTLLGDMELIGKEPEFRSEVSATNADGVTDSAKLICDRAVKLRWIPGSILTYSAALGWRSQPDARPGVPLQVESHESGSGAVWACWEERVVIVYRVEVVAVYD